MSDIQYQEGTDNSFIFQGDMDALKEVNGFLTGKEWYTRFQQELAGKTFLFAKSDNEVRNVLSVCIVAAKRAATIPMRSDNEPHS